MNDSLSESVDMGVSPLAQALINEHHEIDAGIEAFVSQTESSGSILEWAQPLVDAMTALRRHIYLEEEIIFPRIRIGALQMAVMVMLREHGEIWRQMDELEALISSPDADQEPNRSAIVAGCNNMLELLEAHNMKEEPVIYPHVDADLDWVAQAHLKELLAEGVLPEGWVCERALP